MFHLSGLLELNLICIKMHSNGRFLWWHALTLLSLAMWQSINYYCSYGLVLQTTLDQSLNKSITQQLHTLLLNTAKVIKVYFYYVWYITMSHCFHGFKIDMITKAAELSVTCAIRIYYKNCVNGGYVCKYVESKRVITSQNSSNMCRKLPMFYVHRCCY